MPDIERTYDNRLPPPDPAEMADRLQRRAERILDLEAEVERLREAALRLALWTQHHRTCARAESTAYDCTCGLQEAWIAFDKDRYGA